MSGDEDGTCGAPGPAGQHCTMPKGHPENRHCFTVELTPDLGALIATMMDRAEHAQALYLKAKKRNDHLVWALWTAIVLNLIAMCVNVIGIWS